MYVHCPQLQVSPVVRKAGQLLLSRINEVALCIAYPESASFSGKYMYMYICTVCVHVHACVRGNITEAA